MTRDRASAFYKLALPLISRNMKVLPCKTDKAPYTPNGLKDASGNHDTISAWAELYPDAQIGIACAASDIVVLDVDNIEAFKEYLFSNGIEVPATVSATTASGGKHYYFKPREGAEYPGKLIDGVDIKYHGYVIAPPSECFSKRTGNVGRYTWDEAKFGILEAPAWLERQRADSDKRSDEFGLMKALLAQIDPDESYDVWVWVLMNVHAATNGSQEGLRIADAWSSGGSKYRIGDVVNRWHGFDPTRSKGIPVLASMASYRGADLDKIAQRHGYGGRSELLKGESAAPFLAGGPSDSASAKLLKIAEEAEYFHSASGEAFADIWVNGRRETWGVTSRGFRQWLIRELFTRFQLTASTEAEKTTIALCEAKANFGGPLRKVFTRTGMLDGNMYVDLCDEGWRAVEINAEGWRIVELPPVRFRRTELTKPLPLPKEGGDINALRELINVSSEQDFVLLVGWALQALTPSGPYPPLMISGEQGSAKSTCAEIMRTLVDPNDVELRSLPTSEQDLFLAAKSNHVIAFDNLSGISNSMSDALCRLATGGTFATRRLYTNDEETTLKAERPMILNGIGTFAVRSDLIDRSIFVSLARIDETRRRKKKDVMSAFSRAHAKILGALLSAISEGISQRETTVVTSLPRMADTVAWVAACETFFWPEGTFLKAYLSARRTASEEAVDTNPIASAVLRFLDGRTDWTGTAADLLGQLSQFRPIEGLGKGSWPTSPGGLGKALERCAPSLRELGIEIDKDRTSDAKRTRILIIRRLAIDPSDLSDPSIK